MRYKGQEVNVASGDIICYRTGFVWYRPLTYISAAIRFFTRVEYNHAAIAVKSWDVVMINEARGKGIITRPAEKYLERKQSKIVILRPVHGVNEGFICRKANSALGRQYDFIGLVWYQLVYRLTKKWWGRTEEDASGRMVCSEYAAWCYGMPSFWLYSVKELMANKDFIIVYKEK